LYEVVREAIPVEVFSLGASRPLAGNVRWYGELVELHRSQEAAAVVPVWLPSESQEQAVAVVEVGEALKRHLAKNPRALYEIRPRAFEELIASILEDYGYDVELTPLSRDGGKDISAMLRSSVANLLVYVECKRYAAARPVGINVVQRLYGVARAHHANKSMVVTTSYFTREATQEARLLSHDMALRDYDDLCAWLKRYT
jgi:restriction endonuclease Mrr